MWKRLTVTGLALAILGGLFTGQSFVPAQDKNTDPIEIKPDPAADDVRAIAMAFELAEFGRKSKSPEMLIAAAKVLRTVRVMPLKDKPKVEAPPGVDPGKEEPAEVSLLKMSDALLKEARDMGKEDKLVVDLAERAAKEKTRAALGGPKATGGHLRVGVSNSWSVNFIGRQPATVSVQGNGRAIITLTALNELGKVASQNTGTNPSITWVPRETRNFTIQVNNTGPGPVNYQMFTN